MKKTGSINRAAAMISAGFLAANAEERSMKNKIRIAACAAVLLAVLVFLAWLFDGGVSNRMVRESVLDEGEKTRALLNARADAIESRLSSIAKVELAIDEKLSRVEKKLDALVELATPKLPDGMREVEEPRND